MSLVVIVSGGTVEVLQASHLLRRLAGVGERVVFACPPSAAELAHGLPGVAEIVPLRALSAGAGPVSGVAAFAALRGRRLEAALVCSDRDTDRLLAYSAGIARRIGTASGPTSLLLTDSVPADPGENAAATWLRLADVIGANNDPAVPAYDPGEAARRVADHWLLGQGFEDGRLLVALVCGTGFADPVPDVPRSALAWDPERFAHLANQLHQRHGAGIILLGTADDRSVVDLVLDDLDAPPLDLCGMLDLSAAAAVVSRCDLLVAGDTPLLHLAAAQGTPAIGLFGPTDGRRRGPFGAEHRVVQSRNGRAPLTSTMQLIRVDDVLAGIEAAM
jgi:ADP-heptose:LPS heptosyltransferase